MNRINTIGVRKAVPREFAHQPGRMEHEQAQVRREMADMLMAEISASPVPVVVQMHQDIGEDIFGNRVAFAKANITQVQTMEVTHAVMVSDLTFKNARNIEEWKCTACGMINPDDARYCGERFEHAIGCGHPRHYARGTS